MDRRNFLKYSIMTAATLPFTSCTTTKNNLFSGKIVTVTGAIVPEEIGSTLPHEHIMSAFGAEPARIATYDESALFNAVIPYLNKVKALGCDTVFDCTTIYFGRAPQLLQKISLETGVKLVTNTGYYAAANDRYVPESAFTETAQEIAARWIDEFRNGIDDTNIYPGFIKIGVDEGPLSEIDAKIVRAAAITHRETGLAIASHTGENLKSANQQLDILASEGVNANAWIWVHANKVKNSNELIKVANRGAWIELDGVSPENTKQHLELMGILKEEYLGQILLSHDGNSFRTTGRPPKPYDSLYTHFIPALKNAGYTQKSVQQLLVDNPAQAFRINVRKI